MNTVTIRKNGKITIPAEIRRKYSWNAGQTIRLIDLEDGSFFLSGKPSRLEATCAELDRKIKVHWESP